MIAQATFTKLKSGEWGLRVDGAVKSGDQVNVSKRDGTRDTKHVGKIVWQGNGITLCTIYEQGQTHQARTVTPKASTKKSTSAHKAKWVPPAGTEEIYLRNRRSAEPEYGVDSIMWANGEPRRVVAVGPARKDDLDYGCCDGYHHYYAVVDVPTEEAQALKSDRAEKEALKKIERDIEYALHDDMALADEYAKRRADWDAAQAAGMTAVQYIRGK